MSSRLTQVDVSSVGLTAPAELSVSGSPVTQSGNLGLSWANETANKVLAGPTTGSPATPGFRALVAADIPALSYGTGTVTSVGLSAPAELSVGSSPITTSGTLALTWANESANQVLAGPTSGGATTPGFRALVAADIPNLDAGKITTGTLALARGGTAVDNSSVTANRVWAGPTSGGAASASYRALVAADIPALSYGTGTVTSVAMTVPSILSISGSPITTSGTLALSLANESANLVLAGPTSGIAAAPTFRALVAGDIPNLAASVITSGTLALARGGTNADNSSVSANQVWAGPTSGAAASAGYRALVAADIPNLDAGKITTGTLAQARGGTNLDTSGVTDGQLLIGQTSGHSFGLATLTAGTNVTITNAGHAITIAASGGGSTTTHVAVPATLETFPQVTTNQQVWMATSGGTSYTDNTAGFQVFGGATFAFAQVNDAAYFGTTTSTAASRWFQMNFQTGTAAVWTATFVWEYYNGATWATLGSANNFFDGSNFMTTFNAAIHFQPPATWAAVAVNGVTGYYIRMRCTAFTSSSTSPALRSGVYNPFSACTSSVLAPVTGTLNAMSGAVTTTCYSLFNVTQGTYTVVTTNANAGGTISGLSAAVTYLDVLLFLSKPTGSGLPTSWPNQLAYFTPT